MKTLLATTEDFIKRERTRVTADVAIGNSVVIPVANSSGFVVNDWAVVGFEGAEGVEIAQVTAVTANTITVAALTLNHKIEEPVTKYRYNQRKFYGCATVDGSFVELTAYGSPAAIEVSDPQGTYFEYTGSEGYIFFKATYFNSQTSDETDQGDSDAVQADESLRYCSIYDIRQQAGITNNPFITDGTVEGKRAEAENEVKSYLLSIYTLPLQRVDGTLEVPALIKTVTMLLAAGKIDFREYGADGEGVKWLGEARGILNSLKKGSQRLIGTDNKELSKITQTSQVQSFPDTVDNCNGPSQMFTTRDKF